VRKFVNGSICNKYGVSHFPHITQEHINHIKIHFKKDNISCSKGALTAGLTSYINMIKEKKISYIDPTYYTNLKELYLFYNIYKDDFPINQYIKDVNEVNVNEVNVNEVNVNEIKVNEVNVNEVNVNEVNVNEIKVNEIKVNEIKVNEVKVNEVKVNEVNVNEIKVNEVEVNEVEVNEVEEDLDLKPMLDNINDIELDIDVEIEEYLDINKILEIKKYIYNQYIYYNKYSILYYGFKKIIPPSKLSIQNTIDKSYSNLWLTISYMGSNIFDILETTKITEDFINFKADFN
jgi:hypothetical protein